MLPRYLRYASGCTGGTCAIVLTRFENDNESETASSAACIKKIPPRVFMLTRIPSLPHLMTIIRTDVLVMKTHIVARAPVCAPNTRRLKNKQAEKTRRPIQMTPCAIYAIRQSRIGILIRNHSRTSVVAIRLCPP